MQTSKCGSRPSDVGQLAHLQTSNELQNHERKPHLYPYFGIKFLRALNNILVHYNTEHASLNLGESET